MTLPDRVIEEQSKKFPYFRTYAECQSQAFVMGWITFLSMAAGVYIAQELMKSRLPYRQKTFLFPPIILASLSAYSVTKHRTRICQEMWMSLEEKHTALSPISEKNKEKSNG